MVTDGGVTVYGWMDGCSPVFAAIFLGRAKRRGGGLSQTRQVDRDCEKVRKMKENVMSSNKQWIIIVIKAAVKKKKGQTRY